MVNKRHTFSYTKNVWHPQALKKYGIAVIILLMVVVASLLIYKYIHDEPRSKTTTNTGGKIDYSPAPPADNSSNETRKGSSTPSSTLDNTNTPSTPSSTPPATFTVQILNHSVNNGNIHIGTLVSGTTSGNCAITASKAGQTTLQLGTSSVAQDVNNYDCGVYNISTTKFASTGDWLLTLTVSYNGMVASNVATVTIPNNN